VACLVHVVTDRRSLAKAAFLLLSLPFGYALFQFRAYALYSIVLATALWLSAGAIRRGSVLLSRDPATRTRATWGAMALLIAGGTAGLWNTGTVQQIIVFRDSYLLLEGSNLRISFTGKNPVQAFPLYAYSFVSNVIGPLVWQIRAASNALNFLLEIPFLTYVGYGLWRRRGAFGPGTTFLVAQAFVWFALISFTNDNLGTASRLRVVGWQCLILAFVHLVPRARLAAARRPVRLEATDARPAV
jgi:hypothetical protein